MPAIDRRSWTLLRGRFSARATTNRQRPVEAAGAVDAKNAPTAPWKTAQNAVSHSYHRLSLLVTIQGRCPGGPHFVLVLFVAISYALVDEAGAQAAIAPCAEAA